MITDIKQIIGFYLGQKAVIVAEPKGTYTYWKKFANFIPGDKCLIHAIHKKDCWLDNGSKVFPIPYYCIKLLLKPYHGSDHQDSETFRTLISEGYDVFKVIGTFAFDVDKRITKKDLENKN